MIITKNFIHNDRTRLVSDIFDKLVGSQELHLPFNRIELTIQDTSNSMVNNETAVVCIGCNDPVVTEKDRRGIAMLIYHELFRLMFKFDVPKPVEDVIIGKELAKRGFGDGLFYLYYITIMNKRHTTLQDHINLNIPWIVFNKQDPYNSDFMKRLAKKLSKSRPECRRLFNLLLNVPKKDVEKAATEYNRLVTQCSS